MGIKTAYASIGSPSLFFKKSVSMWYKSVSNWYKRVSIGYKDCMCMQRFPFSLLKNVYQSGIKEYLLAYSFFYLYMHQNISDSSWLSQPLRRTSPTHRDWISLWEEHGPRHGFSLNLRSHYFIFFSSSLKNYDIASSTNLYVMIL